MDTITEFRKIGRTLKSHGLEGGIVLEIEADYFPVFLSCDFIFLDLNGSVVPFYVEELRQEDPLIIYLEDVTDPETAADIVPVDILLPADLVADVHPEGESVDFGWAEGFVVFSLEGDRVGRIIRVETYPRQAMAFVEHQGREVMLPLHMDLISEVDENARSLILEIPEGLLDLGA